ncbi:uncharacterized protein LOC108704076 isoform X3 [Xenopus laevis]|uniref:Uncharacterized protein LOC108704076 isoform X3 n=1 Tax=Xenopus laevis TaxID=8355 RepID=A0A8J1L1Y0_XENLA|nr:uncharacterized protein LOC108704076 isoform X3 [Xenopus laevis]
MRIWWTHRLIYRIPRGMMSQDADLRDTEEKLQSFCEYLNTRLPTIKFTLEFDKTEIHFLDVKVEVRDGKFETDIYRKPTDKITYLDPKSFHPPTTVSGLPYSQLLRVKRIVSTDSVFEERADEMMNNFVKRGYKQEMLEDIKQRVREVDRADLLVKKKARKIDRLPFVSTFSSQSKQVRRIMYRHWHLLQMDQKLKPWTTNPPIMAYKRPPNLRDRLVHAVQEPMKKQENRHVG